MTNPDPTSGRFAFRELEAGPRRDVARMYYALADDLSWLKDGPEKDKALELLADARDAAVECAETMLRS